MNRRRSLALLAAFIAMAASLVFVLHGDQFRPPASRPGDAYGPEALGHTVLREVFERIDVPVLVDREGVAEHASGAVLFIEPAPERDYGEGRFDLQGLLLHRQKQGLSSVVVLPKWQTQTQAGTEVAVRIDKESALAVLHAAVPIGATRLRREDIDIPETAQLRQWTVPGSRGDRRVVLQERQTLQLDSSSMEPLLGTRRSALVARFRDRAGMGSVIVVSDPDLLHNFNLHRGDHGLVAQDLVAYAETDAVVIDEVLHGHGYQVSWAAAVGAWPTAIVVAHALLLALLYTLAVARRFGPPKTASRPGGVAPLVALAADAMAGTPSRAPRLVAAYACAVIANVADRLGVPASADLRPRARGVDQAAARYGIQTTAEALLADVMSECVSRREALDLARAAYRLRSAALTAKGKQR